MALWNIKNKNKRVLQLKTIFNLIQPFPENSTKILLLLSTYIRGNYLISFPSLFSSFPFYLPFSLLPCLRSFIFSFLTFNNCLLKVGWPTAWDFLAQCGFQRCDFFFLKLRNFQANWDVLSVQLTVCFVTGTTLGAGHSAINKVAPVSVLSHEERQKMNSDSVSKC